MSRRLIPLLAVVLLLCAAAALFFASGARDALRDFDPTFCSGFVDPGVDLGDLFGTDERDAPPEARVLLDHPDFAASMAARGDLEAGVVDPRLVRVLRAVVEEHEICVDAFKEGHYFIPGVEDTPVIPEGYGEAGGLPNTHYFGRAADIRDVDGQPVEGNGGEAAVLGVGRVLAGLPPERRPDQIIGPAVWNGSLGRSREEGWILDPDQVELHEDHIHVGFREERGTRNTR